MTKRVLVIGGGIGGPVAALALHRAGWEPEVFEAYDNPEGAGLFVTLAGNGLAALEHVGMRDQVAALGMETPGMRLISARKDFRVLGSFGMQAHTVPRSDLYAVLHAEAVRRGIGVHRGRRLVSAQESADGVRARFADGGMEDGDLLVGADGLRSTVRSLIDPKAPAARPIGVLNTGGFAHGVTAPGEPGVAQFVFGRRCFFGYFVHPNGTDVWWFANPPWPGDPTREELAAVDWRERLRSDLAQDAGPMLDILAATDEIFPAWSTYDLPTVPTWHTDRTVLVGDAVHAASPSSGQGASMAIEDGVELARCLRDSPDPLRAFEKRRRDRVERIVRQGRRNGSGKSAGPVAAWFRDLMMPPLMRRFASGDGVDWMTGYRIDWEATVSA